MFRSRFFLARHFAARYFAAIAPVVISTPFAGGSGDDLAAHAEIAILRRAEETRIVHVGEPPDLATAWLAPTGVPGELPPEPVPVAPTPIPLIVSVPVLVPPPLQWLAPSIGIALPVPLCDLKMRLWQARQEDLWLFAEEFGFDQAIAMELMR